MKLLEVWPAATVTLEGTVRLVLLLESEMENPPAGALPFRETVQELVPGVLMVNGLQFKVVKEADTGRVMLPEVPLEGMEVPPALDATTLVSWMTIGLLEGAAEIWKVAVATVPSGITVLFNPAMMQGFPTPLQIDALPGGSRRRSGHHRDTGDVGGIGEGPLEAGGLCAPRRGKVDR